MSTFITFQNAVLFCLLIFTADKFIVALRVRDIPRAIAYGIAGLFLLLAFLFGSGLFH
jgi:hypothetical protein